MRQREAEIKATGYNSKGYFCRVCGHVTKTELGSLKHLERKLSHYDAKHVEYISRLLNRGD